MAFLFCPCPFFFSFSERDKWTLDYIVADLQDCYSGYLRDRYSRLEQSGCEVRRQMLKKKHFTTPLGCM